MNYVSSPAGFLSKIGAYQARRFNLSFNRNQTPLGVDWAPLAANTLARKRNRKVLVESAGRIPGSLYWSVRGDTLGVGYSHPLAIIHHYGATIPARQIVAKNKQALFWAGAAHPVKEVNIPASVLPARPLVGYTEFDAIEWNRIFEEGAQEAWD